ncbi:MAG: succinylglutamate desuccinylase [Aestuariibacter sp.]|uniref:succinylglutamate desuccinylase/aspartoacylase family protein n=1 Tax=Marisediminitalea aggregata TaxID=634436 RepID=UPI0020CC981A|nr:succinylglutamate desuccinylase/aspartoacylase family protein [Marisediminitalea aggregata]MCP3865241.1 succinylglutamate desuccinylase [Aestuariibacter sp.]MCP4525200.1 succinylglutamate desuccinylase [Aestuariibacter sp.]MCP4947934.1 succinylglutamate desuccinylase [Aestuariibacter sp.]MCP9477810.1 M14 family metallopeptidase [Marisediminitalea aggregata]
MAKQAAIEIGGVPILPGTSHKLRLTSARLYTDTDIAIPVEVVRAKRAGPTVFISAAIHGDELNGIEIVRRVMDAKSFKLTRGTLIAVPLVNVYGLLMQSRYMPDRRDLNRSFPGSAKGSLTARLAHLFLEEIVSKCQYGVDLHTGAIHRSNLPQIRANLEDQETAQLANEFGVPVLLNANLRDGSLRQAASEFGTKILLYEAGEALRFDELSIRAGVKGIFNVLSSLGMVPKRRKRVQKIEPFVANRSSWLRAPESGIVRNMKQLGDRVKKGDVLANVCSPSGAYIYPVKAPRAGVIIGQQNIPLVQEGDAMFHIAMFEEPGEVVENMDLLMENLMPSDDEGLLPEQQNAVLST